MSRKKPPVASGQLPVKRKVFLLPPETHKALKMAAILEQRSMVDIVRTAIAQYFKQKPADYKNRLAACLGEPYE